MSKSFKLNAAVKSPTMNFISDESKKEKEIETKINDTDKVQVVDENGKFIGLVTDGDIRRMLARGAEFLDEPVEDLMTKNPVIITKDKMAAEALSMMEKHQPKPITVLPVIDVEKNEPVGIVHLTDLLRQGVV